MGHSKEKLRGFVLRDGVETLATGICLTGVEEGAALAGAGAAGAGTAATGITLASALPYISAAVTAAGVYAQSQAQDKAAAQQKQALQQAAERDAMYQKKSLDIGNQEAQQYDPTMRAQNEQAAQDAAQQSLTGTLVASRDSQVAPAATGGKVSNDFTMGQAKTAAGELQRSTNIAKLMAAVRGPTDLRAGEAINNAGFADQASANAADRSAMANAGGIDVSAIHPDGTAMLLGSAAQSLGTAGLASGLVKKAKTTTPTVAASVPNTEWYRSST